MIGYCSPSVLKSSTKETKVKIKLRRRTKNHLKTMYFGALCIGADFTAGLLVLNILKKHKSKANLIFKDFQVDFLKRADSNIVFICNDHDIINESVLKNLKFSKRENFTISVDAFNKKDEIVSKFKLTTSIK